VNTCRLNEDNLSRISESVSVPEYHRPGLKSGIVHVGVGNFHRSHEAFYTDLLLGMGVKDWGICGICLLDKDLKMYNTLADQDGLYSLIVRKPDGNQEVRIIGSIVEYLYAPSDPYAVIRAMADPGVKIISLTITEGGYNFDPSTGQFLFSESDIQWDLQHPEHPKTIFGYLTAAFHLRKENALPGLSVLSCDNIQRNGEVCKQMLMTYIRESKPELSTWVEGQVTFPNSMVDRITPVSSRKDIEELKTEYHIEDGWPVVCEPFVQWIIEDDFSQGRPPWDKAGVQFVTKVEPYEKMKIRLLNAGHSLLGFTGSLYGYSTIDETVKNPLIVRFLSGFMDQEVSPLLGSMEGIDLEDYKNSLMQRFANPYIGDQLSRICSESSSKIPKFLLPTIEEQLKHEGQIKFSALVVATWCRHLELAGSSGHAYEVQDAMKEELVEKAKASMHEDPLAFLKIKAIFGKLVHSGPFVETYLPMIENLRKQGTAETIRNVLKQT
jgi:mannitol 2-dehydrogenase